MLLFMRWLHHGFSDKTTLTIKAILFGGDQGGVDSRASLCHNNLLGEAQPLLLRNLINRFIVVKLIRSADEHLCTEDNLDTLKTKWALVLMVQRRVEVFVDTED